MKFENPQTYTWICDTCRQTLSEITANYGEVSDKDTDDREAPSMFMYDNSMYCGGKYCKEYGD